MGSSAQVSTRLLTWLPNAAKDANDQVDPANPWTHFREATWEEALDRAADIMRSGSKVSSLAGECVIGARTALLALADLPGALGG